MRSEAESVTRYIAELPEERRAAIKEVRGTILANLPEGYQETMNWGMISYEVPLDHYPDAYNGKPLLYVGLASQKRHMALYLSGVYADDELREAFLDEYRASGKKLDMGKSCVRFTKLENLPVELIGKVVGALSVDDFIAQYEASRS